MSARCVVVAVALTFGACSFQLAPGLAADDAVPIDAVVDPDADASPFDAPLDAPNDAPPAPAACALLTLGSDHSCALRRSNGSVDCWGQNAFGELGGSSSTTPVNIPTSIDLSSRAYSTCAVAGDGSVRCWGYNDQGQIGDGTVGGSRAPTVVSGIAGAVVQISVGRSHVCARRNNGSLRCWGSNGSGQLGDGTTMSRSAPTTDVTGLSTAVARVTTGGSVTCAHAASGMGWCWGDNDHGQLGDNTTVQKATPLAMAVQDVRRTAPASFSVGVDNGAETCAIIGSGEVWCWGDNAYGQLGNGMTPDSLTPVRATGITDALEIAAGRWHVCVLHATARVSCWGRNFNGEVGDGTLILRRSPVDVGLANVVAIGAGGHHSCAINTANEMYCWGLNSSGQLGDGTLTQRSGPVRSLTICS